MTLFNSSWITPEARELADRDALSGIWYAMRANVAHTALQNGEAEVNTMKPLEPEEWQFIYTSKIPSQLAFDGLVNWAADKIGRGTLGAISSHILYPRPGLKDNGLSWDD